MSNLSLKGGNSLPSISVIIGFVPQALHYYNQCAIDLLCKDSLNSFRTRECRTSLTFGGSSLAQA
ncbi:unnamed protein product [Fusarium fujikuroi]|uniref:Uncharacterized protein n=1 Tax=Fusarium fujikuroi TaxID=5127 RepID=A0A9Q9UH32_FUSFU|nr:uncharacterized protein FFFS_10040 [Fusarium fujikuroi]VTT64069.1 unnamed protein product [Fusarium fujikuroi]VTT83543.1 unnamed protein product [Fusarium fujikuroi]VZI07089.1 unnamed protein product [Fusarium fujikuroi]